MDTIHDRANKFINDVRKKKIKVSKNICKDNSEQNKQDSVHISDLSNTCFYCQKIFYSPEFLVKHILRRHAKDLILLYKKCLKSESNNNSSDMKQLLSFLEKEFVVLKNELKMVQFTVSGKNVENDIETCNENFEPQDNDCNINENKTETNVDIAETHGNELQVLKEKVCDLETNIQCLHNKLEEVDSVLKTDVLSKQNIKEHIICNNEKILRAQESQFLELGQTLLKDLQIMLSKQLYENNGEWTSHVSELKNEIKRIDCVIEVINKQVSSPDYIKKIIEEKFGPQMKIFLGGTKNRSMRKKNLKSKSRVSETKANTKFDKKATFCLSADEVSYMVAEQLSYFNIKPNTSKISCTEFNEKLQLINCEKESLKMKYPNFSEIYNNVNLFANHKVKKLLNQKSRKIRFSEPLISSTNGFNNSASIEEDFHNKTYPSKSQDLTAVQNQKFFDHKHEGYTSIKEHPISESEEFVFADGQGSGDCPYSFKGRQIYSSEEALESTPVKSVTGPLQTSSPIEEIQGSQKPENIFSKNYNVANSIPSCSKISSDCASAEKQSNLDYTNILKSFSDQDEEISFVKNLQKLREMDCDHNSDGNDFDDKSSLQSLSSWED